MPINSGHYNAAKNTIKEQEKTPLAGTSTKAARTSDILYYVFFPPSN